MSDSPSATPRRIMLATDLSARSDRPLDRALRLARHWDAELIITHIVEPEPELMWDEVDPFAWQRWPARNEALKQRILDDLGDISAKVRVVIDEGSAAERICSIAEQVEADMIVTGVARAPTFGRTLLGATVQRLVRTADIPVLIVKRRAEAEYQDLLVTFDFSDASAHAVSRAAALFPQSSLTLLHGYDPPFRLALRREGFADYLREAERQEVETFVSVAAPDPETRERINVLVEHGDPVRLAQAYIADRSPDLTVVASHGRSAIYELAIGSVATKMLNRLDSDILLVRRPTKMD